MVAQAIRERTMNYPIPREAEGLGTPVGTYRRSRIWPFLGWSGGLLLWTLALWGSSLSPTGTWWTTLVFSSFGLLSLGKMVWIIYTAMTERVVFFNAGMVHQKRGTAERYAWADIKQFKIELSSDILDYHIIFKIVRFDEQVYVFDGRFRRRLKAKQPTGLFQQFSLIEAVTYVYKAVKPVLCHTAINQYTSGGAVDFAAFQVSQRGIQTKDITLEWSAIADIAVQNHDVAFFTHNHKSPRLSIPLKEIRNPFVLGALLNHIGAKKWTATAEPEIVAEQPFGKQARRR
jgi:hypothetical protein